jgi:hypothetical protein
MSTDLQATDVADALHRLADQLAELRFAKHRYERDERAGEIARLLVALVDAVYPHQQPIEVWSALRQIKP